MASPSAFVPARLTSAVVAGFACLAAAGCGGGADYMTPAGPGSAGATALSGTVAVGAPITNGRLRILDASGAVVASDVAIDAEGHYAGVTLTGPAPYRLEACGYAGPNYLCVYSVANAAGTANVTPLTSAMVLLATGASPDAMMAADAPAVSASGVSSAQDQLRSSLAGVLSGAGVSAALDFVSGALTAGSRSGYDGVLDAVGVSVGQDTGAFVQITPRIGSGNLYMQQGSTVGTVTAANTSSLGLAGIETLFRGMSAAMASANACADASTGIRRSLSSIAQMTLGDRAAQGPDDVAAGLCQFFATGDDGATPMWGSTLLSPTLGRCDLSGSVPVCAISFVIQSPDGDVMPVGDGMGVTKEGGVWKFMGDLLPVQIRATARAQRTVRVDATSPVVQYDRAIQLEVAAVSGLACARVAQHTADGSSTTIAFYKRFPGAAHQTRLSLWGSNGMGTGASLDPLAGSVRSADDTWLTLPQGTDGDVVIRNFYRGGRTVTFSLFADDSCSTPFTVAGRSVFDVEIQGVPPVSSAMESLPWPEIDGATVTALRSLTLDAGATGTFHAGWAFARGPLGLDDITVCGNRDSCGDAGSGRIGSGRVRASARDNNVALHNNGAAVTASSMKMLALSGRNSEGVGLQSNYMSCPQSPAGENCH
ncbi:MAG: hypothetical protein ABI218_15235 [Caldimonas sp.]